MFFVLCKNTGDLTDFFVDFYNAEYVILRFDVILGLPAMLFTQ